MKTQPRRGLWFTSVLVGACAVGIACGSSDGSSFGSSGGPNAGDSGVNNSSSGKLGSSGQFPTDDSGPGSNQTLIVDPPSATISVTDVVSTATFTAKDASGAPITGATWTLSDYTLGNIDTHGVFTPKGTVGGTVNVIATFGGATGQATITVTVNLVQPLGDLTLPDGRVISQAASGISQANQTALTSGTPGTEGTASKVVYPYDNTVMPRGLLAPTVQLSAGDHTPEDFRISLGATNYQWGGYGHFNPDFEVGIPQSAWDGAFLSAQPDANGNRVVTLSILKASGGAVYGPSVTHLVVAPVSLTGVIYYSSYSQNQLMNGTGGGGTDFGLWSVRPGTTAPPNHLQTGCVICHSVSANGKTLTTGSDPGTPGTGVYATTGTTATQLSSAPNGLGGDTRGLSWAAISPDGDYILRSQNNFWGGGDLLAWKAPATAAADQPLSDSVAVTGGIKMFVPSFSPDGSHLVYVNSDPTLGAAGHSVGIVDVAIDRGGAGGQSAVALTSAHNIYDGASAARFTRVPTFLPDSHDIVLQETPDTENSGGFDGMLPNWTGTEHVYTTGALYTLRQKADGSYAHVVMANANTGSQAAFATANYEPKPLPVQAGGYYWVVFTSIRSDGIHGTPIKKLWITAISPGSAPDTDPSHPPFLITNQSIIPDQHCERAYWSVEPCHADGLSCASGDDCCGGFCRPSVDGDPTSPFVCKKPTTVTCAADGDRCRAGHNEDCCGAASGVQCIGSLNGFGTCAVPAPK